MCAAGGMPILKTYCSVGARGDAPRHSRSCHYKAISLTLLGKMKKNFHPASSLCPPQGARAALTLVCKYLWTCKFGIYSLCGCLSSWLYIYLSYRLTSEHQNLPVLSLVSQERLSCQPQHDMRDSFLERGLKGHDDSPWEPTPCSLHAPPGWISWAKACFMLIFLTNTKQAARAGSRSPPNTLQY